MACKYCEGMENIIYEDEQFVAFLKDNPCVPGHTVLMPKKHYTIIEQVPEEVVGKLFSLSNTVSGILFEVLGIQGTNVLINNGVEQEVAHFSLSIIPRKENDGVSFDFQPLKLEPDQMDIAELGIKEGFKEKEKVIVEKEVKKADKSESSWMEKAMTRVP